MQKNTPKPIRKIPTVRELKQEAKEKGFKGVWKLKKLELLNLLKKDQTTPPKKPTRPPPPPSATIIQLIQDRNRVKEYEATKMLERPINQIFFDKVKQVVEMGTTVVYKFSCLIYRLDGQIAKTFKSKNITSLSELEKYLEECETRRLDLDNVEIWSKAYLPSAGSVNIEGAYEGRVEFTSVYN